MEPVLWKKGEATPCNSFELVLKDEYFKNYMEKSGWHIDNDKIDPDLLYMIAQDEAWRGQMEEQGDLYLPAGADIKATVHFEYDGETLGLDDPMRYSEIRYPVSYSTEQMNPIAFDRETSVNLISYAAVINAMREEGNAGLENAKTEEGNAGSEDAKTEEDNAGSEDAKTEEDNAGSEDVKTEGEDAQTENYTETSVFAELNKEYVYGHLARVGVAGSIPAVYVIN